jgi:hypothetical protein
MKMASQGILTEWENSLLLTNLHKLVQKAAFLTEHFYKTSYLNRGVNRTELSPSERIPLPSLEKELDGLNIQRLLAQGALYDVSSLGRYEIGL